MNPTFLHQRGWLVALSMLPSLLTVLSAPAAVISVNLTDFATDVQQVDADETFGIASQGSVVGGWVNLNRTLNANNLAFSHGAPSSVNMTGVAPNGWGSFGSAYADTPLPGGLDDYTSTVNPCGITLSNLSTNFPKGYKVIVYVGGFSGATPNLGASISDGTTTYYYRPLSAPSAPVTFVRTTQTADLGSGNNPVAQYAVFGDPVLLTANSVTFTLDTLYGGGSGLCGFQIVGETNHPPVASDFSMGVVQGGSATVAIIGGKRSPTDADDDPLTIAAVQNPSSNGATLSTDGNSVSVSYAGQPAFTGTDTFTYTVSDGLGGADTRTVTVMVTAATGFNQLSAADLGGGTVRLSYLGIPGTNYALDWRTNLSLGNWLPVTTNAAAANGHLIFTNTSVELFNFYRTRYVP